MLKNILFVVGMGVASSAFVTYIDETKHKEIRKYTQVYKGITYPWMKENTFFGFDFEKKRYYTIYPLIPKTKGWIVDVKGKYYNYNIIAQKDENGGWTLTETNIVKK